MSKIVPPTERRPGFGAFAVEVSVALAALGKPHLDALAIAKQLYTNGMMAVRNPNSRGFSYVDNPHLGGKCVELLPKTLKAWK